MKIKNIYFDNAATSWPKPETVYTAAEKYLRSAGGNPGRSAHTRSVQAERLLYETRERAASFLGASFPNEIIFTLNATDALNMAIKGILEAGDHVIHTSLEHNSVLRPLGSLKEQGIIETTMVPCDGCGSLEIKDLEAAIRPTTKLIVCTHASNVIGRILPVKEIGDLAEKKGVYFLLDAAQTGGCLPIDLQEIKPHLAAFAGHKGLLGPPGVGLLYVRRGVELKPWREGGTGSRSEEDRQPRIMPDYLEAGTMNAPGLAGLNEGLIFLEKTGIEFIRDHELKLADRLRHGLSGFKQIRLFGSSRKDESVAVVSFIMEGIDCGELGYILEEDYGILSRTGLHCAPYTHSSIGTFPQGTVRFSLSFFNTEEEVDLALNALQDLVVRAR